MKVRTQAIFSFVIVIFFIVFVSQAQGWRPQARLYPLAIGIPMLILAIVQLILDLKGVETKKRDDATPVDFQFAQQIDPAIARRRAVRMFMWLFGFFVGIWLLGFSVTIPLMVFTYLKLQSNESWRISIVLTAVAWAFFYFLFVKLLLLPFPDGLVFTWLGY